MPHYKLQPRAGYSPETYNQYEILNGTQFIGWVMICPGKIPILCITAEKHEMHGRALASAIRKIDQQNSSEVFLVTQYVKLQKIKGEKDAT